MQIALTRASHNVIFCIVRTTITISDELLGEAQKLSGKSGYSDAIVTSLSDYVALRKRLALLEQLFRVSSAQHRHLELVVDNALQDARAPKQKSGEPNED